VVGEGRGGKGVVYMKGKERGGWRLSTEEEIPHGGDGSCLDFTCFAGGCIDGWKRLDNHTCLMASVGCKSSRLDKHFHCWWHTSYKPIPHKCSLPAPQQCQSAVISESVADPYQPPSCEMLPRPAKSIPIIRSTQIAKQEIKQVAKQMAMQVTRQ